MKRPALIALFLLMPAVLSGCALFQKQSEPADKVAAIEATFTATVTTLTDLRRQGRVSDANWKAAKEVAEGGEAMLEAVHAEMDAGNKVDADALLKGVRAALDRLLEYKAEAERERTSLAPAGAAHARLARNAGQEPIHRRAA